MTRVFNNFINQTTRRSNSLRLSLLAIALGLTLWIPYRSTTEAASGRPTPSGERAVNNLRQEQPNGPLSAALQLPIQQQAKLLAADGELSDRLGKAVAMSGDTLVVSAPSDRIGTQDGQGSAYVFTRTGTTWSQQAKLTASDGKAEDFFGDSVAISDDTIVVGVPNKSLRVNFNPGAAYVFTRTGTTWSLQQKLTVADGADGDRFGYSVGISGDTIVVSAPYVEVGANQAQGTVYVFTRTGTTWSQQAKLTASDGLNGDQFGYAAAISGDTFVASAPYASVGAIDNQGKAYVFSRTGTAWNEKQKLTAADGDTNDLFGLSVAISYQVLNTQTIAIGVPYDDIGENKGQGSAYLFLRSQGVWSEQQKLIAADGAADDHFGNSVATNDFMTVVGADQDDVEGKRNQGSAYVFRLASQNIWQERYHLTAADGEADDKFATSVAFNGQTVAAGAPHDKVGANSAQGSTYAFTNTPPTISPITPITVNKGSAPKRFVIGQVSDPDQSPDTLLGVAFQLIGTRITPIFASISPGGEVSVLLQAACDDTDYKLSLRVSDYFLANDVEDIKVIIGPDIEPPQITCAAPIIAVAPPACPLATSLPITYNPPTVVDNCPGTSVACNPPSGSSFPVGTSTVTCTAKDAAGNTASCSFAVTIFDVRVQDDTTPSTVLLFNSQTGQYRLCANGQTYTGTGVVTKRSCAITLTHNATDRRVQATVDTSVARGNASMQMPAGTLLCTITDRDIRNDSTLCP